MAFILTKHTPEEISAEFYRLLARPPENSRIFEFTPELSANILDPEDGINRPNRNHKPIKITQYAKDLQNDEWVPNGATVVFSAERGLLDGQNRLMASVASNCSFITHAVFGVPEGAFDRIDIGKPRNAADIFRIAGVANASPIAGAVRWIDILTGENPKTDRRSRQPRELLSVYHSNGMDETLPQGLNLSRVISRAYGRPTPLVLAIWYLAQQNDSVKAAQFLELWANGDALRGGPMIKANRVLQSIREVTQGRVHDRVQAAIIINAWNDFKAGRKGNARNLNYTLNQPFPMIG